MSDTHPESELITPAAAAAVVGRCERTISRWICRGRLSAVRSLGRIYVVRADLERLRESVPAVEVRTRAQR